jgi:hypothetical protein
MGIADAIQWVVDWLYTLSPAGLVVALLVVWWVTGPRASRYIRTVHTVAQYVLVGWAAIYAFMLWGAG